MVSPLRGVKDERLDFHDVEGTIIIEHLRVTLNIDNLADELGVQTDFNDVEQAALEDYRELHIIEIGLQ